MNKPVDFATATQAPASARILALRQYRLQTLTLHADSLVLVVRGTKELTSAARTFTVQAGQAVMLAADSAWDVVNQPDGSGRYEAWALAFDPDDTLSVAKLVEPRPRHALHQAQVLPITDTLLEVAQRTLTPALSAALRRHRLSEVLLYLAENDWMFGPRRSLPWTERIRQLVTQRPDADWSASQLAAAFHTSEATLRRRLSGEHGSLLELVRQTRLETALALLQTTNLTVGEVAHRCGWPSHSRFSSAFKRRWGVLPSQVTQVEPKTFNR